MESNEELPDFMNEPFSEDYLDDPTVISLPGKLSTNRVFNHDAAVVSPSPSPPPTVASSPLSSTLPPIPTLAPISAAPFGFESSLLSFTLHPNEIFPYDYRDDVTVVSLNDAVEVLPLLRPVPNVASSPGFPTEPIPTLDLDFDPLFAFDPLNDRLVPSPITVEVVPPTPSPPPKDPSVAKSNLAKSIMVPKVKKKRIRKKEPKKKKYVEKRDNDVLLGRGGCANNHQGNKIYLQRVLGLQKWYKTLPRDKKSNCSNSVVQWIHNRGGRFLKRENKRSRWYIVTPATARQKVSQALREDHTPEGRALKKSKAKSYKH